MSPTSPTDSLSDRDLEIAADWLRIMAGENEGEEDAGACSRVADALKAEIDRRKAVASQEPRK